MSVFCCENKTSCITVALIASAVLGVVAALLQITGVIDVTPAFLWVALGIAIGYMAILLGTARCCRTCHCNGAALAGILTGILGTALSSVILLAISFASTSIVGAIFVGVLVLFLSLIVSATACYVSDCARQND